MSQPQSIQFLSPEEIATRELDDIARIKLPTLASVFKEREIRLRQLAPSHAMRDYLIMMADLSSAQHSALNTDPHHASQLTRTKPPTADHLADCAKRGVAPLFTELLREDEDVWLEDLKFILNELRQHLPSDSAARSVVEKILSTPSEELRAQAYKLLHEITLGLDMAYAPMIGAALQVYWSRLVKKTESLYPNQRFPLTANRTRCPCCGSKPVASINSVSSDVGSIRYLHCSLCQTQWYMTRIQCARCESTKGISYQTLDPLQPQSQPLTGAAPQSVAAETCDECHHYLKICNAAKDPHVEPVADDLASLSLDLLVSEEGLMRHGVNFMLLFGPPPEESEASLEIPQ